VIAAPPLLPGAAKLTVAEAFPPLAETAVGAPGTVRAAGVTLFDAADAGPVPAALLAVTVNVYAVPSVRPATTSGLPAPDAVNPPGLEVAV
jgi:hypothetical protein